MSELWRNKIPEFTYAPGSNLNLSFNPQPSPVMTSKSMQPHSLFPSRAPNKPLVPMPEEQIKFRIESQESEQIQFPQTALSEPNLGASLARASDKTEDDMSKLRKQLVPEIESAIERILRKHGLLKKEK